MTYTQAKEIIRFVEHCVYQLDCKDRSLHTLLFSLYVRYQPEQTLPYLNAHGEDVKSVPYDAQSALRLCLAADSPQLQACVLLYRIMGLYQPAVEMALKIDAALARQTADMPEDNEELRKKLWLRIGALHFFLN
jgi:vacuolar protein sorting-associated protein 18